MTTNPDPVDVALSLDTAIEGLQESLESLKLWGADFDRTRNAWGYPSGVEQTAHDALELGIRLYSSTARIIDCTHSALVVVRAQLMKGQDDAE